MKLAFPRYMYNKGKSAVLVEDEKGAEGLFVAPPHKWAKDEKPFAVKK